MRLRRIEATFEATRTESRMWYWTWLSSFAALTTAQLFLVVNTRSEPVRDAYIFGAVGSVGATLQLLAAPFTPAFASRRLHRLPDRTPAQRRARLARAEALLEKSAREERRFRSIPRHAAAVAYPLITAGYLYLRYRNVEVHRIGGMRLLLWGNLIGGFLIPEAQSATTPRSAITAWEDYAYGSRPCMAPALREERRGPEVMVTPFGLGAGVSVRF